LTAVTPHEAAITRYDEAHGTAIEIRHITYLHNLVAQDHRAVQRITRPMLGFKSFAAAQDTLVGIELMHMIKKRQLVVEEEEEHLTAAGHCQLIRADVLIRQRGGRAACHSALRRR
jgi:transposase-like protein